ncbi:LRR domain containing protein [Trema orientale]|uniref:LRR domain containing protein n=1 Tax=Trema orientale TaxID=63057 RepID=A0A2P5AFP8_TREOI|nr:LRR domain containing protein [Trema orientale]
MKGMTCLQNRFHFLIPYSLIIFFSCSVATQHVLNTSFTSSAITCLPHQRSALLQLKKDFAFEKHNLTDFIGLYDFIDSYSYPKMKFWKEGKDCCGWDGNRDLTGFLPNFHSGSKLKSLSLYSTGFSGRLPDSIGNLRSLNELDIWETNFSGTIPSSVGNLSQLVHLDLEGENLYGQIPSTLGNLSQLQYLWLSGNNLNGQLPSTLKNLAKLTYLQLEDTGLTGELPFWLGNLRKLQTLYIGGNRFNGQIPSSLGNLSQLQGLELYSERLDGKLSLLRI